MYACVTRDPNANYLQVRVLRPMAAIGFVKEVGEQRWTATAITKAMATEEIAAGQRMV